jgi:chemotaxis protein methyltransferase CheR
MSESSCIEFLQWALPRLSLAWPGFRKVRRQVCRRVGKRVQELTLPDLPAYRVHLEAHPEEWRVLDSFCWIPISRLLRDRIVFDRLTTEVLPQLAAAAMDRAARELRFWSAGCASGEEPYSLNVLWKLELASRFPDLSLAIVATDIDERLLERARAARYRASSLRELPRAWVEKAFTRSDGLFGLRPEFRAGVEFFCEDIREGTPRGPFDLILCRNLAFTYFDVFLQQRTLERILGQLRSGGALVIGLRERLPEGATGVADWDSRLKIYRKSTNGKTVPGDAPAGGMAAARWS